MKIVTLDKGINIENYQSISSNYLKIMKTEEATNIGIITIGLNGVLGYHQAPVPQLFMVVNGEGWVRGADQKQMPISSGQTVFFEKGEWHETGSEKGLTAFVLQAGELNNPFK